MCCVRQSRCLGRMREWRRKRFEQELRLSTVTSKLPARKVRGSRGGKSECGSCEMRPSRLGWLFLERPVQPVAPAVSSDARRVAPAWPCHWPDSPLVPFQTLKRPDPLGQSWRRYAPDVSPTVQLQGLPATPSTSNPVSPSPSRKNISSSEVPPLQSSWSSIIVDLCGHSPVRRSFFLLQPMS
jgi:hypothetical protein